MSPSSPIDRASVVRGVVRHPCGGSRGGACREVLDLTDQPTSETAMDLSLAEEYLLLGLDDTSGRPLLSAQHLRFALAGASVADLTLHGALEVSDGLDGGRPGRFRAAGRATPSDPLQHEVLDLMHDRRPKDAIRKVGQGSFARGLRDSLQQGLAARGVL